jgi:crotonobetainyl-CoA:carnitine CoA-transferase CaiB-like acyl-CoA transferase
MPYGALRELTTIARLAEAAGQTVEISGADPVLPTRYRIGTAVAASLAASGLAAAELWALRTGRRQHVTVDLAAAAISLRSARYMRIDGVPPPPLWDRLSGFYPVRHGRWIYLHCNFPHHRDRALAVLGAADREGAEWASAAWQGETLEEAVDAAGGCAGFARAASEWRRHAQAAAIAALPLFEITRIGDAPPERLPPGDRPLAGIRVLDLTRVLAGPTCAKTLAEHGADVLKITAAHLPDSGAVELDTGIGKLSARLDLRDPADVARLRELIRDGDVFSQSYRPGALAARGFSPGDLTALRPGIVCLTLSAWGHAGPWQGRRGFDSIVQNVSGMIDAPGDGSQPRLMPVSAIDYVSGYLMAFGAMVALARRAREGGSWLVRVSLARTGRWIVERGTLDDTAFADVPDDLPPAAIERLSTDSVMQDGTRLRHLAPVVGLSETRPRWQRPPAPIGFHDAVWPARS